MNRNTKLMLGLACLSLGLTACTDDYFDQETYNELIVSAFPVDDVDQNHTWATVGSATANVTVNGDYEKTYRVAIYEENPLYTSPVTLLAAEEVVSGEQAQITFPYALASNTVFVACFDENNRRVVQSATVGADGIINVNFFGASTSGASSRFTPAGSRVTRADGKSEDIITQTFALNSWKYEITLNDAQKALFAAGNYLGFDYKVDYDCTLDIKSSKGDGDTFRSITLGPSKTNAEIVLTADEVAKIKNDGFGLILTGYNITMKRIYISEYSQENGNTGGGGGGSTGGGTTIELDGCNNSPDYTKTANDYLHGITVAQMEAYTPFTAAEWADFVERSNTNATISSDTWMYNTGDGRKFKYQEGGDGRHYRIPANVEITQLLNARGVDSNWQVQWDGVVIYVQGKLHLTSANAFGGVTLVVANGGEIILDSGTTNLTETARFVVLDGGKITGQSGTGIDVTNGADCYNAGEITFAGRLNVNGSDFYNCGDINVTELVNTTAGGLITNYGSIIAVNNDRAHDTYNCEIINACYMHYTGSEVGIGTLTMLEGSRLDCDGLAEFNQTTQNLYPNSVINVGTLFVTNTVFNGPSAENKFAIVKTGKICIGRAGDITAVNNTYFDWNETEIYRYGSSDDNGSGFTKYTDIYTNQYSEGYIVVHNQVTKHVTEATAPANMTIPASRCTGAGYNTTPATQTDPVKEDPISYRFCFEDNFPQPGDYDFNDCVVTITPVVDGKTVKLTVSLDATGANKQIAAALRLVGISEDKIASIKASDNLDEGYTPTPTIGKTRNAGTNAKLIDKDAGSMGKGYTKDGTPITDAVISLFNDAHYTLSKGTNTTNRYDHMLFYNTVSPSMNVSNKRTVASRTTTYTISMSSKTEAQKFNDPDIYDLFIVEHHNSIVWEVHTRQYKYDQVLQQYYNANKLNFNEATAAYPWAICVKHTENEPFYYPIEWNTISGSKIRSTDDVDYGSTDKDPAYPDFKLWARSASSSREWYKNPDENLVYK